jgi:hypothetical protein
MRGTTTGTAEAMASGGVVCFYVRVGWLLLMMMLMAFSVQRGSAICTMVEMSWSRSLGSTGRVWGQNFLRSCKRSFLAQQVNELSCSTDKELSPM